MMRLPDNDPPKPGELPPSRPPPDIPDHRVIQWIGRGSYGEVWLAENTFGTRRAVKVVRRDSFEKPEHFQRELDGVRHFEPVSRSHDAVVDVLQVGQNEAGGWFHYVMELADDAHQPMSGGPAALRPGNEQDPAPSVPPPEEARRLTSAATAAGSVLSDSVPKRPTAAGYLARTLHSELAARGRLPVLEWARIGVRLAEALEHLHEHGLVHRDIKPSNVIYVNGVPKLADIGLVSPTGAQSFVGTEGYVAPEGPGKPTADIFSLGKVLYELATGKDRRAYPDPLTNVGREEDSSARADLNQILLKACELNPLSRYQRATELKQELLLVLAGRSVRDIRRLQNRLALLRRIGLAALIVVVLAVAALWQQWRQTREVGRLADANRQQLVRLNVSAGVRAMDSGDLMGSLPWFVEALRLDAGHPRREEMHRYRIEAIRRLCPKPVQMGFHRGAINRSEVSPDGARLLTASNDGTALIWDLRTGEAVIPPLEHDSAVLWATFSPDGNTVATSTDGGLARLWDARTGAPAGAWLEHGSNVVQVAFSPDGRLLATASWDGNARLFDVRTAQPNPKVLIHQARVHAVTFSRDGRLLAVGTEQGVSVWNVASGERLAPTFHHPKAVGTLAFSQDGKTLLTGCDDGVARLWRSATGECVGPPMALGDRGAVWSVAFSPDERWVALSGGRFAASGEARVWEVATGQPVTPPLVHSMPVRQAAFSSDGRWLATGCGDGALRLWDARSGQPLAPQMRHQLAVWNVAFSDHGRRIVSSGRDGSWHVWDLVTEAALEPVIQHNDRVVTMEFSPDARYLATASWDQTARVWDAATFVPAGPVLPHDRRIHNVSFSPDGNWLATGSGLGGLVWDWRTGKLISRSPQDGHGHVVHFCPDASVLLSASGANTAGVWDPIGWQRLLPPLEHRYETAWIQLSADGRLLVTGAGERDRKVARGEIKIWDRATGRLVAGPFELGGWVNAVALSPDNRRVVAATSDESVEPHAAQMWEVSTGRPHGTPLHHSDGIHDVQFSLDGRWVATAGDDGVARVWEAETGSPRTPPLQHKRGVNSVRFSPDGRRVLTASMDGSARLWEAETGAPLSPPLTHAGSLSKAIFGPGAMAVVTAGHDGAVQRWQVPPTALSLAELTLLAKVFAGGRLNQAGIVEPSTPVEWATAWKELRAKRPELFTVSNADIAKWHARQAQASERAK